jgi:hypothetical protein
LSQGSAARTRSIRSLSIHDLLAGPWSGRLDVAGQRERAGSEVHGGDRLVRIPEQVDHMTDPLDVLEEQLIGVVNVHV